MSRFAGTAIPTAPQTQSLWLTDIAHHHLAIAVVFIIAGHTYRTNSGIGHSMKEILEALREVGWAAGTKDFTMRSIILSIFNWGSL